MYLDTRSSWVTGTKSISVPGIADLDVVLDHPVDLPLDDALEHADAVGDMHHIVAGGEVGQRTDGVGFLLCLAGAF